MFDLVQTPSNPTPPGASVLVVKTRDGVALRAAVFTPQTPVRGAVALFQGRAEFIEKYYETIGELLSRGLQVATLDWRGQGGSERELANPRKGHVDDFSFYQRDLEAFAEQVLEPHCSRPFFALAHSMGGVILLEQAHSGPSPFQRLALIAPMIDIAGISFPNGARLLAATLDMVGLGAMYIPGGGDKSLLDLPFESNKLTGDAARFARNAEVLRAAPHLALGDPTVGWANAAFRQMKRLTSSEFARASRVPALFFVCGRDEIVSTQAIERFAQLRDVTLLAHIAGARHELLMETDERRAQFWASFDAFVPGSRVNA